MKLNSNVNIEDHICSAAARLFSRYGIRTITMNEIAAEMRISKKTIYTRYQDKDELVHKVYMPALEQARQQCTLVAASATNAVEEALECWHVVRNALLMLRDDILHDLEKYHHRVFEQFEIFRKNFLWVFICKNIQRGKSEMLYRPGVNEEIIAAQQVVFIGKNILLEVGKSSWKGEVIEKQLMQQYLHGLCTAKGQEMLEKYRGFLNE